MPLSNKLVEAKSAQNLHMNKLINLVNSRHMVDFMSELFCMMQDLYPRYVKGSSN